MSERCLIIGASGEIGSATVLKLVEAGYRVGVQYHSNNRVVESLKKQVPAELWEGSYQGDLSSSKGIREFLSILPASWDAIVFSGGHLWKGLFQDMEEGDMDALYHVHTKAPWMVSRHVLPNMIRNKRGNIVVVSSIFGEEGASMEVVYSSVKAAQIGFVKGLAKEIAPSGIRVNAVTPGLIQTKMNQQLSEEEWRSLEEEIPIGRAGTTEEVANAVLYLLSDQSSYITGQTIKVNGGW
ncbi:elongation factor P 5-aminopentanone reductase [Halobacillus sp. BBL2006]|uniref:elongation factor P 5-aminopentanone reductase n=1 Tax=Halobacillus sp. BBL2006 TaxID=1543706 RepID=UPI000541C984|nr:SDR family oxidoreductase [Halobacillus sp. BBL2006]KHE67576.1 3-ketoacyl-ACP reductase [Halobacillus sp. BBL2006]